MIVNCLFLDHSTMASGYVFHPLSSAKFIRPRVIFLDCFQCNLFFYFYRKIQDALEKQNRESFKKRDHEKRKVDEATEKAKELMRVKTSFCVEAVRTGDFTSDWSLGQRRDANNKCGIPFVVIVHFHRITTLLVQLRTQFW